MLSYNKKEPRQDKGPLADFLPTLTMAAKNLATEMKNYNVEEKDLQDETAITVERVENNTSVRNMLGQRGIKPENQQQAKNKSLTYPTKIVIIQNV